MSCSAIEVLVPERYRPNHPVEIGLNPIETDEGTMVLSAIVDISKRKENEERIYAGLRTLAHMNGAATAGELTASIAHEVSQPLAAMVANANADLRWLIDRQPPVRQAASNGGRTAR
jgi:C4-dicarboxylate-specific signal transduction histidine kinase